MLLELCFGGEKVRYVRNLKFHIQCCKICLIEGVCATDWKTLLLSANLGKMEGENSGENSFEVIYAGWFLHLVCNIDEMSGKISIFLSFI